MKTVVLAQGKINLSLDVLKRLENGYHSVEMVMLSVPLCDKVTLEVSEGEGIELLCNKEGVPTDSKNTAYKSARLFLEETKLSAKVKITLEKNIPAAAGMAGGSTDAAAVLKGLNDLFGKPLSEEKLLALCLKIGADVPFCLKGGCALSQGIGEVLTPIAPLTGAYLVIAKPDFEVSTKWVYESLDLSKVTKHPDTKAVIDAIARGDLDALKASTANVLESVTEREYPVISEYKALLYEKGARASLMSGSGPTVFGIFNDKNKAEKGYNALKALTKDAFLLEI